MATNTSKTASIGILVFLAFSAPALAQQRLAFQFGARAGIPLTNSFRSDIPPFVVRETADRVWLTAGPTFGAFLYNRLLIELDAMYKPFRGLSRPVRPSGGSTFELRAASFEFPVVFDYFFSKRERRLYAGGGIVAGHVVTGTNESHLTLPPGSVETPFEGQFFLRRQLPAYVANAGIEWNTSRFAIRPEIRYTNWRHTSGFGFGQNQLELAVGFSLRR